MSKWRTIEEWCRTEIVPEMKRWNTIVLINPCNDEPMLVEIQFCKVHTIEYILERDQYNRCVTDRDFGSHLTRVRHDTCERLGFPYLFIY